MLILGTGWVMQELDSDLWETGPRASMLPSNRAFTFLDCLTKRNRSLQLCCQNRGSSEDFISKKRLSETFVDWSRQFWKFFFAVLCLLKKDCKLSNGLSGNSLLHSATFPLTCPQTPLCIPHSSKFIKVSTIPNVNSMIAPFLHNF